MRKTLSLVSIILLSFLLISGCQQQPAQNAENSQQIVGAWRADIQFNSGAFAPVKDLEFMYIFNPGGGMTESSNYDAAPPVPPAYCVWRATGENQYEAKYEFFVTKAPDSLAGPAVSLVWSPAGRGVLLEKFTLSDDGSTFKSTIHLDLYDQSGNPVEGGGDAEGAGERIKF
jgi:hypothetical protein